MQSSPIWQVALIGILFASLLAEIKTAGFSGGGLIAAIAAALLLAGPWQAGEVGWLEPVLLGSGILLLLADLLLLFSGWGAGIGLLMILAGIYLLLGGGGTRRKRIPTKSKIPILTPAASAEIQRPIGTK